MRVEIAQFDSGEAAAGGFDGFYELMVACLKADNPGAREPGREAVEAGLAASAGSGAVLVWTARAQDGRLAGMADVHLPQGEDEQAAGVAAVRVSVDPALRRRGIGTELLRAVLPSLRERGYGRMVAQGLTSGGAGEAFAVAVGGAVVHRNVTQRLDVSAVDAQLWQVPTPVGYHTLRWRGAAPEDLVESFVRSRAAVDDAPRGEQTRTLPDWTVRRLREQEAVFRERSCDYFVVAACAQPGDVVGFTEILVHPNAPTMGLQQYTAVLPEHRGHGLGRAVKAEMMRWILAAGTEIATVTTSTAAANVPMQRVNAQLGYATLRGVAVVEGDVARVASHVSVP